MNVKGGIADNIMKYGIHFGHWGSYYDALGTIKCLEQAKEAGAQAYEFVPTDGMMTKNKEDVAVLRNVLRDLEIEPAFTFGYPKGWNMISDDPQMRTYAIEHLKRAIEGIAMLGGKAIGGIVYANWPADYSSHVIEPEEKEEHIKRSVESLRLVMPCAQDYGVTVNLEVVNRFEHYLINTVEEGMKMCEMVESPNCKLLIDCFHMNIEEDDIAQSIRNAKNYIGHFHLSEPNRKIPNRCSHVDWKRIASALKETGYDKQVIVESFYKFGGEQGHNMRMWRDLDEDLSIENRILLAKEGIAYIRQIFEEA